MNFYLAPMEGITGYVYRNAYHAVFAPADKYVTPFIVTNQNYKWKSKELNDVLPEHNRGMCVIPQIMSNRAGDFVLMAEKLEQLGYDEVNFNLGCPSGTVVAKKKGSGFLAYPDELDRFFEAVFSDLSKHSKVRVSVKTRLGIMDPEDIFELIRIYNRYPLEELIIHPRIQRDFYKNTPNMEIFARAAGACVHPVCYNGDIFSVDDYTIFRQAFPRIETVMLGRGLITNPALMGMLRCPGNPDYDLTRETLRDFHDRLYDGYMEQLRDERNTLFKMKEVWSYLGGIFADAAKDVKKLKKAESGARYCAAAAELFEHNELAAGACASASKKVQ